jgi:glycine/D-amino acid oxidase-like deaminating enzyme
MAKLVQKARLEERLGVEAHVLSKAELHDVAPYVAPDLVGGALWPREGKADSLTAVLALIRAARAFGARLLTETRVVGIESGPGDRRRIAHLANGGSVRAERVIIATGADDALLRSMGLKLPISGDAMQVSATTPTVPLVQHLLYFAGSRLTVKQSPVGSILIGGGWPATVDSQGRARVQPTSVTSNLAVACRVVPALASADLLRTWAAVNNGVIDQQPIVGEVAPGVIFGTFPYLGFTAGPVLGEVLADLALKATPQYYAERWSPSRFARRGAA